MGFRFKDKTSKELFEKSVESIKSLEEENNINFEDETIHDIYQEDFIDIEEFINFQEEEQEKIKLKNENIEDIKLEAEYSINTKDLNIIKSLVKKIESNQNTILNTLEYITMTQPINNNQDYTRQDYTKSIKKDEFDLLKFNLLSFNNKLIIISTTSKNIEVKELLSILNQISEYILSNSFYIFTIDKSPVKKALNTIYKLGMNTKINDVLLETEELLNKIDDISSKDIFEQNYYYSKFLLEKGLLLQSIILLNEAISIYIIESTKIFSKEINKYISIIGEENKAKLYSQAKDFFMFLFPFNQNKNENEKITPLFPNHKFAKDIDIAIAHKFNKIYTTCKNKGDIGLFEKYSYIIDKVRKIRNNLAHGNMEINFYDLKKEMFELIQDFEYLSIKKNIFKYKKRR